MKRNITLPCFCLLLLLFNSCNKSNTPSLQGVGIIATVDGVTKTFNIPSSAINSPYFDSKGNTIFLIQILGSTNYSRAETLTVYISNFKNKVTEGNYVYNGFRLCSIGYEPQPGHLYWDTVSSRVTVTYIDSSNIRGTFSGTVGTPPNTHTITNGAFNLPIQ